MTFDFAGRYGPVAVVTGASSGIGYAFAEELAGRGLDLVVTARRLSRLEELAGRLAAQHGVRVTPYPCDLAEPAAPGQLLEFTAGLDAAMPARAVAQLALDHLADGPTYISSERHAAMIERMSALPRRQALLTAAAAMRKHMATRDG